MNTRLHTVIKIPRGVNEKIIEDIVRTYSFPGQHIFFVENEESLKRVASLLGGEIAERHVRGVRVLVVEKQIGDATFMFAYRP